MLLIKLLKLNSKNSLLFYLIFLFFSSALSNEPVDIWKKKNNQTKQNVQSDTNNSEKNSSINYQKKNNLEEIKITDSNVEDETVDLIGLYDPEENDLKLTMWSNTDGIIIKNTFKRIEKIKLSNFSEKIFVDTIFTYSYDPKSNLSQEDFLKLKINWLVKNNKIKLIEQFLNVNPEFSGKSKLIKYLVDHYIESGNISTSCENSEHINKDIKDNYLDKFRIYCLILNKKKEQAQLNFDLLREEGRSDKFFDGKILFLLGINEKPDNKISEKNLLYFYLSSVTVENFKYQTHKKTKKNILKNIIFLNLISIDKIEDPKIINNYEIAAQNDTFEKNKIFEIYLSIPFSISQLINAETAYMSLNGYESRALIYQKILLSDNVENKLELLFLLQNLFNKDNLGNIYKDYLSNSLKELNTNEIPDNFKKIVEKNIILEKEKELGKIKYDDKILHRSKVIKLFTEENPDTEKIEKDFKNIAKKISRNKKYFFSIKDTIVLETLRSEGFEMPKEFNNSSIATNLTVPPNLNALIEKNEIGMLMLKLTEIIGSDDIESLDPETLYFIVNLLNKAKIKKVRNKILNLTLPLRV